jgi:hypothetical protein
MVARILWRTVYRYSEKGGEAIRLNRGKKYNFRESVMASSKILFRLLFWEELEK